MSKFNREGINILISRFAISKKCVRIINKKLWLNDSGFTIDSKDKNILNKMYLAYYSYTMLQDKIYNLSVGACQKNLNMSDFKNLKIPIPSLDIQNEIVEYCNNLNNMIENMESQLDKNNALMKNILENYLNSQTINDETN